MKRVIRILGVLTLAFIAFSCSRDDDPADNDLFVGTYHGDVHYRGNDKNISAEDSSVTVVKVGNDYNFKFNENGIPILDGVKFREEGDHGIINVDFEDGLKVVQINESTLRILYTRDGQTWTANAKR